MRHYFIDCHDASAQFLAQDLEIGLTSGSYAQAAWQARQRATGLTAE